MKIRLKLTLISMLVAFNLQASSGSLLSKSECQNEYLNLFSKSEINVTATFGYFDANKYGVIDQKKLNFFVKKLTAPCKSMNQKMCGFKVHSKGPHVLTKKLLGPDGKMRTVRITTDAPSISPDDVANRKDPLQYERSEQLKKLFHKGLQQSEISIYMGHSRDGGGPDFSPPRLNRDGYTDYNWYHKNPDNKNEMNSILSKSPERPRIVALISCSSVRWFSKKINEVAPSTGIIGTDKTYSVTNFEESLVILEKIFSYECLKDFSMEDIKKQANLLTQNQWLIPEKDKKLTNKELQNLTLSHLSRELRSPDKSIRMKAYREILAYDFNLYSAEVWQEIYNYQFGNVLGKSLNQRTMHSLNP